MGGVAQPLSGPLWNFRSAEWVMQPRVSTVLEEKQWERRKERLVKLAERSFAQKIGDI